MTANKNDQFRAALLERINQRLKEVGMTRRAAEMQAFGKEGTIRNWGRKDKSVLPRKDTLEQLAPVLGTTAQWLQYGDESVAARSGKLTTTFDPDILDDSEDEEIEASYSREHWKPGIVGALPELDARLGAGNGSVGEVIALPVTGGSISGHRVVAEWLLPQRYLREEVKASPNHTVIMEVVGDSMQPTYMPGDRVLVDLSQNSLSSDTVYAISDGFAEPQIKRLQRVPFSDPTEVRIISDNPMLETFTAELSQLTIIGRICGHIARK